MLAVSTSSCRPTVAHKVQKRNSPGLPTFLGLPSIQFPSPRRAQEGVSGGHSRLRFQYGQFPVILAILASGRSGEIISDLGHRARLAAVAVFAVLQLEAFTAESATAWEVQASRTYDGACLLTLHRSSSCISLQGGYLRLDS